MSTLMMPAATMTTMTNTTPIAVTQPKGPHLYDSNKKFGFFLPLPPIVQILYRVTHQVVLNLLLTSKHKLCFSIRSIYSL